MKLSLVSLRNCQLLLFFSLLIFITVIKITKPFLIACFFMYCSRPTKIYLFFQRSPLSIWLSHSKDIPKTNKQAEFLECRAYESQSLPFGSMIKAFGAAERLISQPPKVGCVIDQCLPRYLSKSRSFLTCSGCCDQRGREMLQSPTHISILQTPRWPMGKGLVSFCV